MRAFHAAYAPPDEELARRFLSEVPSPLGNAAARIDALATRLIEAVREKRAAIGGVEDFLHAYSLSTKEGLALMVLAEALLRVPDAATADRLIEDKLAGRRLGITHDRGHAGLLVSASAWALGMTARDRPARRDAERLSTCLVKRLGLPAVRTATRQAMRLLGTHFVLGADDRRGAQRARRRARRASAIPSTCWAKARAPPPMRSATSTAYADGDRGDRPSAGKERFPARPGISVKLSALHPRYEAIVSATAC